MKTCTNCGIEKDLSMFYPGKAKCKDCLKEIRKVYREKNRDKIREYNKQYEKTHPEIVVKKKAITKQWKQENKDILNAKKRLCEVDKQRRYYLRKIYYEAKKRIRIRESKAKKQMIYESVRDMYNRLDKSIPDEEWRDVKGYEQLYQVSNYGRVYSLIRNKIMKQHDNGHGYLHVNLYKDGIRCKSKVHRLVAIAFINNPNNKPHINHIDLNRKNNCVINIEWVTPKENNIHAVAFNSVKVL